MTRSRSLLLLALAGLLSVPPVHAAEPDLAARAKAALSQTSGKLLVAGLQKSVTVLRDPWGVPHIFAETQADLFFAQGFVAAQDRLWQMEIWRRMGEGRLAEVMGSEAVDRDRFARLLRYRGDMAAEYASYAPDAKAILEAFVRGVNAYIAAVESSPDRLPIEFQLAGFRPEPWTPEVCLNRLAAFGMMLNVNREALRARFGTELGWKLADELLPADPPRPLEGQPRIGLEGGAPVEAELRFTRHGPVIHEDRERHRAYALRWAGGEPGTAGYLAALSLNRARSWPEFQKALERWKVPSENLVYADVEGNIGWQVAGLAPIRKGWSGLLPVPGAGGAYEWQGFRPAGDLPGAFNPPRHFIATANHNILPPGYPHELSFDWGNPGRFLRIAGVLGQGGRKFDVADFQRLQHDEVSQPARDLVRLLGETAGADADLRPWVETLAAWDGTLARDSGAAALYELWLGKLVPAVLKRHVPEAWLPVVSHNVEKVIHLLREPTPRWFGDGPRAGRDAVMLTSLEEAVAEALAKLGAEPKTWRWGALHTATFRHVLGTDPERKALFDLPPVERGGDGYTVNVGEGPGFEVNHGASFREVLDVGDWDRSVATSVPGQSGQPGSPHYGDLLKLWEEGQYFPLLFSREKIEAAATERLVLVPVEGR